MNVEDYLSTYPDIDDDFQTKIYNLKEFNQLKLSQREIPDIKYKNKKYFKYQIFIQRFLSPYTPYTSMLAFHEVGSGKTRTAILTAEINRLPFKSKPLILVSNDLLVNNFVNEISEVNDNFGLDFTDIVETKKKTISDRQYTKLKKKVMGLYDIDTYGSFVNKVKGSSKEDIERVYSNRVIIIDEAHNLRIVESKKESKEIYEGIKKFLKSVKNCKILLLTGTPVWDNYKEISQLMTLITDNVVPTPKFNKGGKITNSDDFMKALQGKVSYIRSEQSDIEKHYEGKIISPMKYIPLYESKISETQYTAIQKARADPGTFRKNEIAASVFSYVEDDEYYYGSKDLTSKIQAKIISSLKQDPKKLQEYSAIFNTIIERIQRVNGKVFVYIREVQGSGALLFANILQEVFGYEQAQLGKINSKKKRYIIITAETASGNIAKKLIAESNKPENKHGEYISVIIGSKKISEGITLKNILEVHIASPYWNMSGIEQVIGRAARYRAHHDIMKGKQSRVNVFLHSTSYRKEKLPTFEIYYKAEKKDIKTRRTLNLLKRIAVDCPLNYERNVSLLDINDSRDCDYTTCKYTCDSFNKQSTDITTKSYNANFAQNEIENIEDTVAELMKTRDIANYQDILKFCDCEEVLLTQALKNLIDSERPLHDRNGLVGFLKNVDNVFFINKTPTTPTQIYPFYLNNIVLSKSTDLSEIISNYKLLDDKKLINKICKGDFTKIDKLSTPSKILVFETSYELGLKKVYSMFQEDYYTINGSDVLKFSSDEVKRRLGKGNKYIDDFVKTINFLDPNIDVSPLIIELLDIKNLLKEKRKEPLRILENIVSQYKNKVYIVHLLEREFQTGYKRTIRSASGKLKYYNAEAPIGRRWKKFSDRIVEDVFIRSIEDIEKEAKTQFFENNPYGYVGLIKKSTDEFSIAKTKGEGRVCSSYSKKDLEKIIEHIRKVHSNLDIKKPKKFLRQRKLTNSDDNPYGYALINKDIIDMDTNETVSDMDTVVEDITKVWDDLGKLLNDADCDNLRKFFSKNKLLWYT